MTSWLRQLIELVRSHWMPISAFLGIPFVALANKYRKIEIDFTFLHAVDVANLSFSLWGAFAVSYFAIYCANHVVLRLVPFFFSALIERRMTKFLDSGVLKDPRNITRYIDFTHRLKLEYSETFQGSVNNYLSNSAWALILMWTGVWNLSFGSLLWAATICYGLFKFDDATRRLRDRISWQPFEYRYATGIIGTREERVERYKTLMQEREMRPKVPWRKAFYLMLKDAPRALSFKIEWGSNHAKITVAVSLLIIALHFGHALAVAAKDGPERLFRFAGHEVCGKLLMKSYYGFHIRAEPGEQIVFVPKVDAIEDLSSNEFCEGDDNI